MTVTRYNEQGEEAPDGVVVFYSDYLGEKQRADAAESELEAVRGELRNERLLKRLDKVRAEQAEERLEAVRKRTIEAEKDAERYRWLKTRMGHYDLDESITSARSAPTISWRVRRWYHDSTDFSSNTIDAAIDRSLPLTGSGE